MSRAKVKLTDRILSLILSVMIVIAIVPVTSLSAFAATDEYQNLLTISVTSGTEKVSNANVKIANAEYSLNLNSTTDSNGVAAFETTDIEGILQLNALDQIPIVITVTKDGYVEKIINDVINANNLSAAISIEIVTKRTETANISVSVFGDATVEIDGTVQNSATVEVGKKVPVKITPAAGSYIKILTVGENPVAVNKGEAYEDEIKVNGTLVIAATVVKEYDVSVQANEGGTVKLDGQSVPSVSVDENKEIDVDVTAKKGYQIASVSIGGVAQTIDNVTAFSKKIKVTGNTVVEVVFVKVYTITVTHNANGTVVTTPITVGGSVTVQKDTDVTITAIPEANYRVSNVVINSVDIEVTGKNDSGYSKTIKADADYTVVITFAPNVFTVTKSQTHNGSIILSGDSIEYNRSCDVSVIPSNGYSVISVKVNGNDIVKYDIVSNTVKFTIDNITEGQNVEAVFEKTEKADVDIESLFNSSDAVRNNGMTYIFAKNGNAIFTTDKDGIILYNKSGEVIGGSKAAKSVTVSATTEIAKIEIVYKADSEMVAMAHEVEGVSVDSVLRIVIDKDKAECTFTPNAANENGYYNSDVTFTVKAEDKGDYSGLALVEYWITLNSVKGEPNILYKYIAGDVEAIYEDIITVDALAYNSSDVKVTLRVVDRAGNEELINKEIKINSTKPMISLAINGTQNEDAQATYYNDQRTLTITVIDREDTFAKANIAKGLELYKDGERVSVAATDIFWNHTDGSNQYVGTYMFSDDAHYKWSLIYKNLAGLSNESVTIDADSKDIYDFYVDKADPYNLNIKYEPNFIDVFLTVTTFGFYRKPVSVTIEATDDTAGIAEFAYTYRANNSDGTIVEESATVDEIEKISFDGDRAYTTFKIPAEFRGKVSFSATDRAGRKTEFSDNKVVVIDTIAPGITVKWEPLQGKNVKYFSTNRTATIEIEEANYFAQDIDDGLLKITADIVYNDGRTELKTYKPVFTEVDGKHVATITFSEEADYKFDVVYTDRSGNIFNSYPAEIFTIDKTAPVISVKYDNNTAVNENYFKEARRATITVVEHNFNKAAMNVLVNEKPMQLRWAKATDVTDTYIAEVPFDEDAYYTFSVNGKDLADNANSGVNTEDGALAPWNFNVDKSSPKNLKISYEPTFISTLLEGLTFGFYKAPVTVKIEATDDVSGIDYFTYSYTVQESASTVNAGKKDVKVDANGKSFITFDIPAQFRGFVSFTATNKSGVSASTADKNAVVVDRIAPGVQVVYGNYDAVNDKYYKADRTATITIEEANYFEDDIKDGLLVITRKEIANDGTVNEETLTPTFTKISGSDKYTATITFDQDADYTFDIKYTDRAGNVYDDYTADEFTVDKIKPIISIEKANGAYFKTDRAAKITVVEHNFRASDFEFTAEAYNVLGKTEANKIDLSSKDYQNYLKNQDNWTKVAADKWEAEITFDIEGNYTIGATYSDLAGNEQVEAITDTFCVDKSNPNNLKITYSPTFIGAFIETATFGFYKAPVKVTVEATDDIAGIERFVYSYTVENGASEINVGKINQKAFATRDGNTNRWYTTFDVPAQFRGNVSFTAYDKSSNHTFLADENRVVVDNVAPGVNVTYEYRNDYDDGFFATQRIAKIEITEANFFEQDIADNLLVITVEKTTNDGKYTSTEMSPTFTKNGDVYTAEIPFVDEGDYTFDIKYTDRSGNVYDSYQKNVFTIDKTAPVINITYDNNNVKNNDQFNANRTATIKIIEHNFRADYVLAKVTADDKEVTSYAEYLKNDANWTHNGDVHTATIEYSEEAHYSFKISCTDKAGNSEYVAPTKFTLDKTAPTDMDIKIADKSVKGSMETHTFDTFYNSAVIVKLSANCGISGTESLKYQKVADIGLYNSEGEWVDYNTETGISVSPSERFVIYFRAEDRAGNVSIIRSVGIVVDNQKPAGEINAPEIDIFPKYPNSNGMFNDDVLVDLKVVDPKNTNVATVDSGYYSGINKITYRIYTTDTDATEEGTLFDRTLKTEGAVFDSNNLVKSWSGAITIDSVKFNSNNVIVEITAVDNAGNTRQTTTKVGDIKIDITPPIMVVSYDNNEADNNTFFNAERTATVLITERNFNAEDVIATISNTDGIVPTISKFTKINGTGNGDDTVWTATIKYVADGDYTFDIAYTDLAGNSCAGETFAEGTVASNKFTIDKTVPVISISYDNTDAQNGNYYKAVRTASVVITEHNFDAERVIITNTATDDGVETTKPTVSGWTSNGDTHTATIYYGKDAKYTFDIAMTDKAGNLSADYTEETFYVDMTMPNLDITGIANNSANKGDVIPVITYSDTNYDADKVKITLTGANRKSVEPDGSYADIHNGRTFTFSNFAEEMAIDDIYTLTAALTDKAGNTTEKSITFSVNRFGSTYALAETAERLNGTYVKDPIDVVVTETNADELSNIKITLFKDGEAIVLKEGTDYKIDLNGGNGQWCHYTYTVFAENFAADGVYSLAIESDDKAGNSAKNDQDTKNTAINFGVDSTLPIINIENLESKTTYALDNMTVKMSIKDNLKLTKVIVELDGKEYKIWTTEELEAIIQNGGNFTFDISGDSTNAHNLVVYAIDAAGNGEKISETELPANAEKVEDFYVTTNLWVRYYTNKPLFFGSIAGVIVFVGLIVSLVVYKKKKNEK